LNKNWDEYVAFINEQIKNKTVFIVKEQEIPSWEERLLCIWFIKHYKKLGFDKIEIERTQEYYKLKEEMGFERFPDFLAHKNGKWFRVEVECFSSDYHHEVGYADVMLCYDETSKLFDANVQVISLRVLKKCRELIAWFEIPDFLYIYSKQFRDEVQKYHIDKVAQALACRHGLKKGEGYV